MIIYKDLLSGDELLSDSYDVKERGMFLEVRFIGVSCPPSQSLSR